MTISNSLLTQLDAVAPTKLPVSRALPIPYASSTPAPPPTPLAKDLSALANMTLLKPPGKSHLLHREKIELLNQQFSWRAAEIGALFVAIYTQGCVTEQDPQKIAMFQREMDAMEKEIGDLPVSLQRPALNKLQKMRESLHRVEQVSDQLQQIFPYIEKVQEARGMLAIDDPLAPGKPLLAIEAIPTAIQALLDCHKQIPTTGTEKARLQWAFESERNFTSLALLDLIESAGEAMQQETAYLKKAWKEVPADQRSTLNRQIRALHEQESKLLILLAKEQEKVKDQPDLKVIAERLQETSQVIRKQRNTWSKWKPEMGLAPLKYGSNEWRALMPARTTEQKGIIAYLNPENWSDRTKDAAYRILAGMQLFQQGVSMVGQLHGRDARLKREADRLQSQVLQAVPTAKVEQIGKHASTLELLLTDKYSSLQSKVSLENLSKRNPEIRPALHQAIASFGANRPPQEGIDKIVNTFRTQQLIQASPIASPFQTLSFSQWWEMFNATEKKEEAPAVLALPATPMGHEVAKIEDAEKKPSGWLSKMVGTVGSFLTPAAPSYSGKVVEKRAEGAERLGQSLATVTLLESRLQEDVAPNFGELRQQVALLHRELLKNVQDAPQATCPLPELAVWLQKVDDTCYGVAVMEQRLAAMMNQARSAISQDDSELQKGGQKHANLIKQVRLVEALQVPGVVVPRPHEIPSDRVEAYCRQHASKLFENWKKLGELYADYKGEGPFLLEPAPKKLLDEIDQALEKTFKAAGETEALWRQLMPANLITWLETVKANGDYLMVRSTGAEDSRQTANAGGNVSRAYVAPSQKALAESVGDVVRSYFSYGSLQNRLNAKLNPFEGDLNLAVTTQQLIGEEIGGSKNPSQVPISLVLFTSEPLYVGGERFRTMRISATYGHGEGVVGNMGIATDTALLLISEAHPDQLYVLYDNQPKSERLAPVATSRGGVQLEKIANSEELKKRPALNNELLHRLYAWGVIGEKFFDDHPTDMEIVIKGNTIFPVQARPVNRPDLLPTYLDLRKISTLKDNPIAQKIQAEMLVPGQASVVTVSHPREIHISTTLEEAEKTFRLGQHKLVVVTRREPANSHPVVNFSSLGIPCLVVKTEEEALKFVQKVDKNHSLAADMQASTINLWDHTRGDIQTCISRGFAVHPAKIALSLPLTATLPQSTEAAVPQDVKDLLVSLRAATTHEVALAKIKELREHALARTVKERKAELKRDLKDLKVVPASAQQAYRMLKSLDRKLERTFDEATAVWRTVKEEKLRPLFHANVIESLLLGVPQVAKGYGQYSVIDVEPIYKDIKALIDYQKGFSHPAHFIDLVLAGAEALSPETEKEWSALLAGFEPLVEQGIISKDQTVQFKQMIATLRESKMLSTWLALFFPAINQTDIPPQQKLELLLKSLPPGDGPFLNKMLAIHLSLQDSPRHLDLLANPASFDEGWKWVLNLRSKLGDGVILRKELASVSPLSRMIALRSMQAFVDTMDNAIKKMKESKKWTDQSKLQQFKKMQEPYLRLLSEWATHVVKDMPTHRTQTIRGYLEVMVDLYAKMSDSDLMQMRPTSSFSVAAALMDAMTEFLRHYPQTLEDMFTLIHQNLISCLNNVGNGLYTDDMIRNAHLPQELKNFLNQFNQKPLRFPIQRTALEISSDGVMAKYNVPLQNHSAQMVLNYDKRTQEITLKGSLLGQARLRWFASDLLATFLDKTGVLPISEKKRGALEFAVTWKIKDVNSLSIAFQEFEAMCQMSINEDVNSAIDALKARRGISDADAKAIFAELVRNSDVRILTSIPMIESLMQEADTEMMDSLVHAVVKGMADATPNINHRAVDIMEKLVAKGPPSAELLEGIRMGIVSQDAETLQHTFYVVKMMAQKGYGFDVALEAAVNGKQSNNRYVQILSLDIFRELLKPGNRYAPAVDYVMNGITDRNAEFRALSFELLTSLVEEGLQIDASIEAAKIGFHDNVQPVRDNAINLINALLHQGQGYDATLQMANADLYYFHKPSFEIFKLLIKHGRSDDVLQVAKKGSLSDHSIVRAVSINLFQLLIENGHGYADAMEAAKRSMSDSNVEQRQNAQRLLLKLIEKGQGYEVALDSVRSGITDPDKTVRVLSSDVLISLLKAGQGVEVALETAKKGVLEPKEQIKLLQALVEKGLASEDAVKGARRWALYPDASVRALASDLLIDLTIAGQGYEVAIDVASKWIIGSDPASRNKAMTLFSFLLDQGQGYQEAEVAMKSVIANLPSDEYTLINSLSVLHPLIQKGLAFEEAVKFCQQAINSRSNHLRKQASEIFVQLVNKGFGFKEAGNSVRQITERGRDEEVLDVLSALVDQGQEYEIARWVAFMTISKTFSNSLEREQSLKILKKLVKKGQGYGAAATVAKRWSDDQDNAKRVEAVVLSRLLVEQGQYYKEGVEIAQRLSFDPQLRGDALLLFKDLIERGQGYEAGKEFAIKALGDPDDDVRANGLILLELLVRKRQAYEVSLEAAKSGIGDADRAIRTLSMELLISLVEKGQGYEIALEVIQKEIGDAYRREALLASLRQQGYPPALEI